MGASSEVTCQTCGEGKYNEGEFYLGGGARRRHKNDKGANFFLSFCSLEVSGQTTCQSCPEGKFLTTGGSASALDCQSCSVGKFSGEVGATTCTDCAAGKMADEVGTASCSECSPGKFASESQSSTCTNCELGEYAVSHGSASCTACAAGFFAANVGSPTCVMCGGGKYENGERTACTDCEMGKRSNSGAISIDGCSVCSVNTYNTEAGSASCAECEDGSFTAGDDPSSHDSADDCQSCTNGQYWNADNGACEACQAGKINSATNNFGCDDCPANEYNSGIGGSSCMSCELSGFSARNADGNAVTSGASQCLPCEAGKFESDHICVECGANTMTAATGQSSCQDCPTSEVSNDAFTACAKCGEGEFFNSATSACASCSSGYIRTQSAAASELCTICAIDTYSNEPNTLCVACDEGKTSEAGSIRVQDCRDLVWVNPCPANTFQSEQSDELADCMCKPGFGDYAATNPQCPECAIGFYQSEYTRGGCSSCETFLTGSTTLATQRTSSADCVCRNSFELDSASSACVCPAGMGYGESVCSKCDDGNYKATTGNDECSSCGDHMTTNGIGETDANSCVCKATFVLNEASGTCGCGPGWAFDGENGVCVTCEKGTFSDSHSLDGCSDCPAGTYQPVFIAKSAADCIVCGMGKFSEGARATTSATCHDCPVGKVRERCERAGTTNVNLTTPQLSQCSL